GYLGGVGAPLAALATRARQVLSQSQCGTPSGGSAPTYTGNDGSSVPAPCVASDEPRTGRMRSGLSGSRETSSARLSLRSSRASGRKIDRAVPEPSRWL